MPQIELERELFSEFLHQYPFQPATAYWRAVEVAHLLGFPFPVGKGLDLGCGDGRLTRIIASRSGSIVWTGLDLDAVETSLASETGLYDRVHTCPSDRVPEPDASFDFVFSNSVLEHIPRISETLGEVARLLRPGGEFLFNVPSDTFHACLRGPLLAGGDRASYLADLDQRLAHCRYWSPEEWAKELEQVGMKVVRVTRYLSEAQTQRWETLSRWTGGLLFGLFGKSKHPAEIQKTLGMRKQRVKLPRAVNRLMARVLALTQDDSSAASGPTGGLLVLARRE